MFRKSPPPNALIASGGFVVALTVLSMPEAAWACPGGYASLACNDPGSAVCESVGGKFECDLARESGNSGGEIWAVLNDTTLCDSTADYCVWGTESTGVDFCCELTAGTESGLLARGTDYDDDIYFQYSTGYNLSNYTTGFTFVGQVGANPGDDTITGSRETLSSYHDNLNGNGGNDTIYGDAGDDDINGEANDDVLYGGPGADTIFGGDDDDSISGGAQDDLLYGNDGDDVVSGGLGADTVRGDNDVDVLCGDVGNDTITGGEGDDTLWGGDNTDNGDGGNPSTGTGDTCDSGTTETLTNCETVSSFSRPGTCPTP